MLDRKIGVYTQGEEGPLLVFIGGIHGNEPSGVSALVRVFDKLAVLVPSFKGKVVGVRGNMAALSRNVRYIDKDLNRLWSESAIRRVKTRSSEEWNSEEWELMELLSMIEKNTDGSHAPEILIDLHTTSASKGLFSIVSDDPFNIQLASAIYAPVILGLTESLTATTNIFMKNRGYKGLAFEAGQHTDPASIDNHEAAVWLLMEKAGCIQSEEIPGFEKYRQQLLNASKGLPQYVEVVYRHGISPDDGYETNPGFANYSKVKAGDIVAKDKKGPVMAPADGMMLMPLYQPQGEEGFFLVKEMY